MTAPSSAEKPRIVEASFVAAADQLERLPAPVHVEVAFAGRSNVGKSSLMNALMGRRNLVRTSSTPGCTRAIGFFEARTHPDARLMLVDLPGYGYAARSKSERIHWGRLIDSYLVERPSLRAVVLLVDVRRDAEEDELGLLRLLREPARSRRPPPSVFVVATKIDQLSASARRPRLDALAAQVHGKVLGISVRQPKTVGALWDLVFPLVTQSLPPSPTT